MIRALVISGLLAAVSTTAMAKDLTVHVKGRSEAEVTADVRRAARQVCREVQMGSVSGISGQAICIRELSREAKAKLAETNATSIAIAAH